jgi:hypothetical protein
MFSTQIRDSVVMKAVSIISTFVLVVGVFPISAFADSSGPNSADVSNNETFSGSDHNWSSTSNAIGNNNQYASVTISDSDNVTAYITAKDFDFSIPSGATINGIEVFVEKQRDCADSSCSSDVYDNRVRIIKNNTVGSTDRSIASPWTDSDSTVTYGSSSDLWGTTWAPSDINSTGFGFALSAKRSGGGDRTAKVDLIQIKVHYTEAQINVCHKTGNSWNAQSVNQSSLSAHLGHGDFEIDAQHPCPPVVVVDTDNDTIPDATDNCPVIANVSQADNDNDGVGNECDPFPNGDVCPEGFIGVPPACVPMIIPCPVGFTGVFPACVPIPVPDIDLCPEPGLQATLPCATIVVDTDEDGVQDSIDNCDSAINPDQLDTDDDGIGDACDSNEGEEGNDTPAPFYEGGSTSPSPFEGMTFCFGVPCPTASGSTDESTGEVAGNATTTNEVVETPAEETSCAILPNYIGKGSDKAEDVTFLQNFLNKEMGSKLVVNGVFNTETKVVVKQFQLKYWEDILLPWKKFGQGEKDATGIVYKTTKYKINKISCPTLDIPMPELP